jgi:predicted nucleotidyltransferase
LKDGNGESIEEEPAEVPFMARKKRIPKKLQEALRELRASLEESYGTRLVSVTLCGSYARGEADSDSDVDVVVALTDCADPVGERARLNDVLVELDLKYDTLISVAVTDIEDLKYRQTPFFINVRREGVSV